MKFLILSLTFLMSLSTWAQSISFSALSGGQIKVNISGAGGNSSGKRLVVIYKKHKNASGHGQEIERKYTNSGSLGHVINTTFGRDEQAYVELPAMNASKLSQTYGNMTGGGGGGREAWIEEPGARHQLGPRLGVDTPIHDGDLHRLAGSVVGDRYGFRHACTPVFGGGTSSFALRCA